METLDNGTKGTTRRYKVILNNRLKGRVEPDYILIEENGPDNSPTFLYEVQINGTTYGSGSGPSKKAAMEAAAQDAVDRGDKTGVFHRL